ncbi:hypothetical protein, partial [Enterobacter cloacae]|uniref:hypothetical protein n=1 Tax=Enterobacter cloacae TaxID=550 RepID=UPI0021CFFA88
VSAGEYDHQFVLAGKTLPNRFDSLDDLEPDTVLIDPWVGKGNYQIAKEAFERPDAFSLGYVWQALKYETIFFDPLNAPRPEMPDESALLNDPRILNRSGRH